MHVLPTAVSPVSTIFSFFLPGGLGGLRLHAHGSSGLGGLAGGIGTNLPEMAAYSGEAKYYCKFGKLAMRWWKA